MIEYFAIAVRKLEPFMVDPIKKMNPDLIQVPLHIKQPPVDLVDKVIANGTNIIGKWVSPQNYKSFDRKFFERLIDKYAGRIKIWDFGGEPETSPHQPGCRWYGNEEEFVDYTRMFVEVVKNQNPKSIIGSAGFLTATLNGYFGNDNRSDFFREVMNRGLGDVVDFISVNAYVYGYGGTKNVVAGLGRTKEILAKYDCDKPIIISETGVPCSGDPTFLHIIQTEERHANSIVESHILFHSLGTDWIVWYQLCDESWGLFYKNPKTGRLKYRKAAQAYKYMIKTLKGARYTKRYKGYPSRTQEEKWLTDKIEWHVFEKGKNEIHVIWVTGGQQVSCKATVPLRWYDRDGKKGHHPEIGEEMTFTDCPTYVIAEKGVIDNLNFLVV